jgi:hypothetical protein
MNDILMVSCENGKFNCVGHKCMKECLEKSLKCPMCEKKYEQSAVFNILNNGISVKYFIDELSKLSLKCANGCEWFGTLSEYTNHLNICEFQVVRCKYTNTWNHNMSLCKGTFLRKDSQEHYSKCINEKIICNNCGISHERQYANYHEQLECAKCGEVMYKCCKTKHENESCEKNIIECIDCKEKMVYKILNKHSQNYCTHRIICCEFCSKTYRFNCEIEYHKETQCDLCGIIYHKCTQDQHFNSCPYVKVSCSICGARDMRRNELENHVMTQQFKHFEAINNKMTCIQNKINKMFSYLDKIAMKLGDYEKLEEDEEGNE